MNTTNHKLQDRTNHTYEVGKEFDRKGKKAGFFEKIWNWVSSLWNKIVSCFSTDTKDMSAQAYTYKNEESVANKEREKPSMVEQLKQRSKKIDNLGEKTKKLAGASVDFNENAARLCEQQEQKGLFGFLY